MSVGGCGITTTWVFGNELYVYCKPTKLPSGRTGTITETITPACNWHTRQRSKPAVRGVSPVRSVQSQRGYEGSACTAKASRNTLKVSIRNNSCCVFIPYGRFPQKDYISRFLSRVNCGLGFLYGTKKLTAVS